MIRLRRAAAGVLLALLASPALAQDPCVGTPVPQYINLQSTYLQGLADAQDKSGVWGPGSVVGNGFFVWPIGPRAQTGWKLHVSFDPANYRQWGGALAHVLFILQQMRCENPALPVSHKLRPLETYAAFRISATQNGAPVLINGVPVQSGKLITIYTLTPEITATVAARISVAFTNAGLVNAAHDPVPGDMQIYPDLPIYTRFGAGNEAPGTTMLNPPAGSSLPPISDDALKYSGRAFPQWKNADFLTIIQQAKKQRP